MNIALITAAGKGQRMKSKTPKLLLPVCSKPILYYTIAAFYDHPEIDEIVVLVNSKTKNAIKKILRKYFRHKNVSLVFGGSKRSESVLNGISYIKKNISPQEKDVIAIHNGANPLVTYEEIKKCIKKARKSGACIMSHGLTDTLKEVKNKKIVKTHQRENFINAQTPQCFTFEVIRKSLKEMGSKYLEMTDEASLVESAGYKVDHIPASEHNFKITTTKDYENMKHILGDFPKNFVVGIGQDSHEFSNQKGLVLGGVLFMEEYKLSANSDGDVLLHSLCNAILQATGEKSLGSFADHMCIKKTVKDSTKYLKKVLKKMHKKGYKLNNIGLMIEGKKPNIDNISQSLKQSLSRLTTLPIERIGITATSGENLTSFGKGKGLQVFSIVSLVKYEI